MNRRLPSIAILDTIPLTDSTIIVADSLAFSIDTLLPDLARIVYSKDSLEAEVAYNSQDSMIYDIANKQIHLYGDAVVSYQTIKLEAAHIILDLNTNIVTAEGMPDSLGRKAGLPVFADGEQHFTADRMKYNFDTKKGVVYDVTTDYNDLVVLGAKSKFITGEEPKDTSEFRKDIIYSQNAIFTTCTHPEPHFGIRSKKQKIIPNKLVVVGPSNLEIMGVPTPLWLPFGFFPISSGRQTGLLFPRDYEYSPSWGFGLRDIGWYFPLGEHFNLSLTGDIYVKGTWGLRAQSNYNRRYKYTGNFVLGYDKRREENSDGTINRPTSFRLNWSHNQAASAHPTNRFGGSINFQTNNYQSRVFNDASSVLQNQLNSNFSFSKNWQDKPITFSVAFGHSQNNRDSSITVNFPNVQFVTQTLYPFRRKVTLGKRKWYEDITFRYQGETRSTFTGKDTSFFSTQTLRDAKFGAKHSLSSGTSFKVFKYFSLNPNVSYQETWNFRTLQKNFIEDIQYDTIFNNSTGEQEIRVRRLGQVVDTLVSGFKPYRTYSASVSLNTQIYGTLRFKNSRIKGIRHVIKPSINFGYAPNYLNENLGYFDYVQDPFNEDELDQYSIFQGGVYGAPSASEQQMAIGYSLNNLFEAKVLSRKDSTDKKIKILDNLVLSGQYNFAADSLKWSQVSIRGNTRFFKGMTNIQMGATFDPYIRTYDDFGRPKRVNITAWKVRHRPVEFVTANFRMTTNITVDKIRALFQGKEEELVEDLRDEDGTLIQRKRERPVETDFLSLFNDFRISHNIAMEWDRIGPQNDTFEITTHSVDLRGSIQLTDRWSINISRIGYDFKTNRVTYPSLGFSRDLHCWQMGMNWAPTRGTYNFFIQVKPGSLDFLRIPYDQNNADGIRAFR
ncbi:MAG: putative LPS assembly protein LptD [Saprospiraceae bacterium]